MDINSDTKLYCLIGHPISKSLSPYIHNFSFNKNNINAKYLAFEVDKYKLKDCISGIKALDIKGFNVTIPHKVDIINYLDDISEEAKLIGAVNTVKNVNGKLIGYNTDGLGFIKSLYDKKIDLEGKNVLILGSGGASRAISMMLAKEGVRKIHILNRTIDKAKKLINDIKKNFPKIEYSYSNLAEFNINNQQDIDIIINCTSVGMYPDENEIPLDIKFINQNTIVYDIIYKPLKTKFLKKAEEKGCLIINGLKMLIYQALISEEIWLNKKLDLENIVMALEKQDFLLKNRNY
ncbi:shikimate dehydrogenase [Thermohalobacter berrensis]|uniref:Shikimate dehydrogenase (NADP(+)) n=1 Tax=Thermohalobacter berrensis TaxID=99594 RepID=A0A419TAV5_9FIRM|nr:shikimate dehydrogenase [Thermohalobacter berrensis]RKD34595.1 shikimate dehydrogenase [Thermohalobacter berrensis]